MTARQKNTPTRQRIAYEAARMMAEAGVQDHEWARRKAAQRLGIHNHHQWPSLTDIQETLSEQQRIFEPDHQAQLDQLRTHALQAMQAFKIFHPRLTGPVLDGTADAGSHIILYLYADVPDEVLHELMEKGIPWEERQRQLRFPDGKRRPIPVFRFIAGDYPIELIVLPWRSRSNPPLSPVTDKPDRGAGIAQLKDIMKNQAANNYLREMGT